MFKTLLINVLISILCCATSLQAQDEIRLMSFNIRYGTAPDGPNHWDLRSDLIIEVLHRYSSDFYGVQEALPFQLEFIKAALPGYDMIGRPRDVARKDEAVAIFYNRDRWQLQGHGYFWLSEEPDIEGSMSWGAVFPRIVTWGRFELRTSGKPVWVFNTHYSHVSDSARFMSSNLLLNKINQLAGNEDVMLMGDLNAEEGSRPIVALASEFTDAYRQVNRSAPGETFFGWEPHIIGTGKRIDYVFAGPRFRIIDCRVIEDNWNGQYPSDHNPIYATLQLD